MLHMQIPCFVKYQTAADKPKNGWMIGKKKSRNCEYLEKVTKKILNKLIIVILVIVSKLISLLLY